MPDSRALRVVKMTLRLLLAALLAGLLAFRPHRHIELLHRDPYVVQTHILLAVVASALMMIVAETRHVRSASSLPHRSSDSARTSATPKRSLFC